MNDYFICHLKKWTNKIDSWRDDIRSESDDIQLHAVLRQT